MAQTCLTPSNRGTLASICFTTCYKAQSFHCMKHSFFLILQLPNLSHKFKIDSNGQVHNAQCNACVAALCAQSTTISCQFTHFQNVASKAQVEQFFQALGLCVSFPPLKALLT